MIRLKDLLREQAEPKKLRVLFVGDSQTVARWSYARQLLKNQDVTGSVIAKNGANTEWVLRQIQRIVANPDVKYDVISIFAGGNDGFKSKPDQAIANLSAAYTLAKQSGARVVAISNPTKKYIEQGNKYYNPKGYPANDEIAAWINSQDISDVTIDTNSYTKTSFMRDNVHLSPDAQRRIVDTWKSKILTTTTPDTSATTQPTTTVTRGGATSLTKSAGGSVAAATLSAGVVTKGTDVIKFFVGKGLTPEQAAGIAGNINQESAFNTAAVGDSGTSHGLAQWHNERWTRLQEWCKQNGFDPNSVEGQLEYLWHELNTTESRSLSKLKSTTTPYDAAYAFAKYFERPSEISPRRMASAETFFNSYKS